MNTRSTVRFSRFERGASVATLLIAIVIVIVLAAAAWFLIIEPHQQITQVNKPAVATKSDAVKKAPPPPADVEAMSTSQLLSEASKAIKDKRLLAPEGNNAFEFYLKVLDRRPDNQVAREALRETFPFATNEAEQAINEGNFVEADREIALLAKADPNNYTLTILRSKRDARHKVKAQQKQDQLAAQQQREQQKKTTSATQPQQTAQIKQSGQRLTAQEQADARAEARKQQQAGQVAAQLAAQQKKQQEQQAADNAKVVIQDAVRTKYVQPIYPASARRMRRVGWVLVKFTVGVDGKVSDAHVVESHPGTVFDRSAIKAVSRWEYKPALRNGTPFVVTMRRRINFKL